MRVIIAGTRSFGRATLEAVERKHDVAGVVAPVDDKLHWATMSRDIPWAPHVEETWVRDLDADLILVAHGTDFIGRRSRSATRLGALVGHPSLLPRHRGRSSVEWTVKFRDPIAGYTTFWADQGVDTGPIARQEWCHVDPDWSAGDLWREALFPLGIRVILDTLADLDAGHLPWTPQDERFATVEPAIEKRYLHRPELPELPPAGGWSPNRP